MSKYRTQPHWVALDEISSRVDLHASSEHRNALRVMVRALHRKLPSMPAFLVEPINRATSFVDLEASEQELSDVRVTLWRLLDSRSYDPDDPEYGAIRAVICSLFPSSRDDESTQDLLVWFLEFWDRARFEPEVAAEALEFVYSPGT